MDMRTSTYRTWTKSSGFWIVHQQHQPLTNQWLIHLPNWYDHHPMVKESYQQHQCKGGTFQHDTTRKAAKKPQSDPWTSIIKNGLELKTTVVFVGGAFHLQFQQDSIFRYCLGLLGQPSATLITTIMNQLHSYNTVTHDHWGERVAGECLSIQTYMVISIQYIMSTCLDQLRFPKPLQELSTSDDKCRCCWK